MAVLKSCVSNHDILADHAGRLMSIILCLGVHAQARYTVVCVCLSVKSAGF